MIAMTLPALVDVTKVVVPINEDRAVVSNSDDEDIVAGTSALELEDDSTWVDIWSVELVCSDEIAELEDGVSTAELADVEGWAVELGKVELGGEGLWTVELGAAVGEDPEFELSVLELVSPVLDSDVLDADDVANGVEVDDGADELSLELDVVGDDT